MNPWSEISDTPDYVLEKDRPFLDAFNAINTDEKKEINFKHPPEPRLGPVDAPVVLLQSNPSFEAGEVGGPADKSELRESLDSLREEKRPHKGALATKGWWVPRLRELISDTGGPENLARKLLTVEFFPYRARNFDHGEIRLPSQSYTFGLVQKAIERDAVIIVSRSWRLWCAAVPDLCARHRKTVFRTRSAQSTYYSRNNMEDRGYAAVVEAIRG